MNDSISARRRNERADGGTVKIQQAAVCFVTLLALAAVSHAADITIIGSARADGAGSGTIRFAVAPSVDPPVAVMTIGDQVSLSGGATVDAVSVGEGAATIDFSGAGNGAVVDASLPSESAQLLAGGSSAIGTIGIAAGGIGAAAAIAGGIGLTSSGDSHTGRVGPFGVEGAEPPASVRR